MKELRRFIRKIPIVRDLFLFLLRLGVVVDYCFRQFRLIFLWLLRSKEFANFTYDLTKLNKGYLISMIANITGDDYRQIEAYILELENDEELKSHIRSTIITRSEKHFADRAVFYGRRLGWYAIARAIKPRIIVETGVDKGLGSCVLTSALVRNTDEGYPGYYFGTDINPRAGYLLSDTYSDYGTILYGDSIQSLQQLDKTIDLFINDSDHSAEYEENEYQTIARKLASHALILGDNSHATDKLLKFALATNRKFVFFQEQPEDHWYPGAGIGIAFREKKSESANDQ